MTREDILELLEQVKDPEIPVISIRELGVLRDVIIHDDLVEVIITPTYTGCPAMFEIQKNITEALKNEGLQVKVRTVLSPAWSTEHMTENGKKKLEEYGIAPPSPSSEIACPHCRSANTEMLSQFGSTACKALYRCKDCLEPFDYFKCH